MDICVYASEVATLCNRNPFRSREEAVGRLTNRANGIKKPPAYKQSEDCKRRRVIALASASPTKRVKAEEELQKSVEDAREQRKVFVDKVTAAAVQSAATHGIAAEQVKRAIDTASTDAMPRAVKSAVAAAVEAVADKQAKDRVDSAPLSVQVAVAQGDSQKTRIAAASAELPPHTTARAVGIANCQNGCDTERQSLTRCEQDTGLTLVDTNKRFRRVFQTSSGNRWVLWGEVDAITKDGTVVETKSRQKRLFGRVPDYELPQILAYMYLADCTKAIQNEDFQGKRLQHRVSFDHSLWSELTNQIDQVVDEINDSHAE
jgi:hypothetical protein